MILDNIGKLGFREIADIIASFLVPGLGNLFRGDFAIGAVFFVIYIVLYFAFRFWEIGIIATIILVIYRLYAAYDVFNRYYNP